MVHLYQVFNNYGARPNEELLFSHGFCLRDNAMDAVSLVLAMPSAGADGPRRCEIVLRRAMGKARGCPREPARARGKSRGRAGIRSNLRVPAAVRGESREPAGISGNPRGLAGLHGVSFSNS